MIGARNGDPSVKSPVSTDLSLASGLSQVAVKATKTPGLIVVEAYRTMAAYAFESDEDRHLDQRHCIPGGSRVVTGDEHVLRYSASRRIGARIPITLFRSSFSPQVAPPIAFSIPVER